MCISVYYGIIRDINNIFYVSGIIKQADIHGITLILTNYYKVVKQ